MPDGPIYRSPADIAEAIAVQKARITPAESAGWRIIDSLDDDVKARLFALINDVPRDPIAEIRGGV